MSNQTIFELNPLFFRPAVNFVPIGKSSHRKSEKICRHLLTKKCCTDCKKHREYINYKLKLYGEDNINYGKRRRYSNDKNIPYKKRKF